MKLQYKSYAKLNLFIRILEKRLDGYHNLQSIFEKINLFDVLTFESRRDNKILLKSNIKALEEENIIIDVINLMKEKSKVKNIGLNINLRKNIPIGAGLGGGSSNAATALIAVNRLWKINKNNEYLKRLSLSIGSDIPFFLSHGNAWIEGRGDIITSIYTKPRWYVLVHANVCISTKKMYELVRINKTNHKCDYDDYTKNLVGNDFLNIVLSTFPKLRTMYKKLSKFGDLNLTGTGGTFFFICDSEFEAKNLHETIPRKYNPKVVESLISL